MEPVLVSHENNCSVVSFLKPQMAFGRPETVNVEKVKMPDWFFVTLYSSDVIDPESSGPLELESIIKKLSSSIS